MVLFERLRFKVIFANVDNGTLFCFDFSDYVYQLFLNRFISLDKINIEQLVFYNMMMLDMRFG